MILNLEQMSHPKRFTQNIYTQCINIIRYFIKVFKITLRYLYVLMEILVFMLSSPRINLKHYFMLFQRTTSHFDNNMTNNNSVKQLSIHIL